MIKYLFYTLRLLVSQILEQPPSVFCTLNLLLLLSSSSPSLTSNRKKLAQLFYKQKVCATKKRTCQSTVANLCFIMTESNNSTSDVSSIVV